MQDFAYIRAKCSQCGDEIWITPELVGNSTLEEIAPTLFCRDCDPDEYEPDIVCVNCGHDYVAGTGDFTIFGNWCCNQCLD